MGTKMNRATYERLIAEDHEWLLQQPRSLERDHIEAVLNVSSQREYEDQARISTLESENARLREDKERLEIVRQHLANAPELNPANYDHDEVVELNAACIMAYFLAGGKPVNEEVPEYKAAQAIIAARKEQKG